ncbi:AraC family transcriptional regulator [Mycolicibacter kumamotonensis]|uniref:AraC family transcriptional regulator n=1 Tax=Mycolicibacter kumamotonensis TaxID=354243 RepID=A0A1X0DU79_9MYCO|nr:helix-turn-helix transcriptional regulator [Mycolicibacter kumamotonensis]ORA75868.1 AraC family transcriptional regulator [Mycolicibacter kumamotonensis]
MTVSARSAIEFAEPANIDLRRGGRARAGSYLYEGQHLITGWHSHDMHQIEYAVAGVVEVETAAAHYLLPPQQAAWIPAGLEHQATMRPEVRTVAVMLLRWPIERADGDMVSDDFFRTLGHLVAEALDHEAPLSLPTSDHPIVGAAMDYTKANLSSVTAAQVCHAVAVSERTLRRQFEAVIGISWRTYLLHARMLQAMALLAAPDQGVQQTATAVGFDSLSAFTRAFTKFAGEPPSSYHRRITNS